MFDNVFKTIFFFVRIPLFLVGAIFWSDIALLIIMYAFFILPPLGFFAAFLVGVFTNNPRKFTEILGITFTMIGNTLNFAFRPYGLLFCFLFGIEYQDGEGYILKGFLSAIVLVILLISLVYIIHFIQLMLS